MSRRLAAAALVALALGACGQGSVLDPAGPAARAVERLWWVMLGLGVAVWAAVAVLLGAAARRGRRGAPGGEGPGQGESVRLVVGGGVVLPVVVLVPLAVYVLVVSDRLSHDPRPGDLAVEVVGHQFWWELRYPGTGAVTANELHVPVGRPVVLTMRSADVIHSFWVPAVHGKIDLIPGQETHLRFEVDRVGTFAGACAEFCGIQHAGMRLRLVARPEAEFERWLARQSADAVAPSRPEHRRGLEAFQAVGCGTCHRIRGTGAAGRAGPDLTHLASRETLGAGVLENRRGQLAGWVLDAPAQKPGVLMPPQPVPPGDLDALLDYLEALE
ncbi:MAG: cytochrome c oxidase subunit II [Acidimicrobiia bacterium]